MQQVRDLGKDRREAACVVEVLHEVRTRWLDVQQQRRRGRKLIEQVEWDVDAEPTGDRDEVNDRVGRAPDRVQSPDRVLERLPGHDV